MAIISDDGLVNVLGDDGYESSIKIIDGGNNGEFFIGVVHVPKLYIGKRAVLSISFVDGDKL